MHRDRLLHGKFLFTPSDLVMQLCQPLHYPRRSRQLFSIKTLRNTFKIINKWKNSLNDVAVPLRETDFASSHRWFIDNLYSVPI